MNFRFTQNKGLSKTGIKRIVRKKTINEELPCCHVGKPLPLKYDQSARFLSAKISASNFGMRACASALLLSKMTASATIPARSA